MAFDFKFSSNSPATLVIQALDDGVEPFSFEMLQPADFDYDGDVDAADLALWEGDFGGAGSNADGDDDSDGLEFSARPADCWLRVGRQHR